MAARSDVTLPSKTKLKQCGDTIRKFRQEAPKIAEAFWTIQEYRRSFGYPLAKVTGGLRSMVSRESDHVIVAQRLKRLPQILNKLDRFPKMALPTMEDIAGCRAVLETEEQLRAVVGRIEQRWDIKTYRDYIANPKSTGYRAYHIVTIRDGKPIEVQLRTSVQQAWADTVERYSGEYDLPLKYGDGPEPFLRFLALAAELMHCEERGIDRDPEIEIAWREARDEVQLLVEERGPR